MRRLFVTCSLVTALAGCRAEVEDDTAALRGTEGGSCQSRADCEEGLACYSGICLAAPMPMPTTTKGGIDAGGGDAGTTTTTTIPMTNTALGRRGETCRIASDCERGLTCIPVGQSGLGRCDVASFGIVPTGKVCGAECKTAADCCELPLGLTVGESAINSCADLRASLGSSPERCAAVPGDLGRACFLFKTYCDCGDAWQCTAGSCKYGRACDTESADVVNRSCPTQTRAGRPLPGCNVDTKKCEPPAPLRCTTDASCDKKPMADTGELCKAGECTCVSDTAKCYRRCNGELDCEFGWRCDAGPKVCVPADQCATDTACKVLLKEVTAKCVMGSCRVPCTTDHQCSDSGLAEKMGFNSRVCHMGFCTTVGCSSDNECSGSRAGQASIKLFCSAPEVTTTATYRSAITD